MALAGARAVSGLPASFPDFLGKCSLAFESFIDTPEGAHHFRQVSLICLKVLRFCVYEHLRQRMSTLAGKIGRAAQDTAPTASKVLISPPRCSYTEILSTFS
jgi:hypothetical protein